MSYIANAEIARKARARLEREPPNPFSKYTRHISRVEKARLPTELEKPRPRIRLALISLPAIEDDLRVKSYRLANAPKEVGDDGSRKIVSYVPTVARMLSAHFRAALTRAIEHWRANIVCFNELGLPTTLRQTPKADALQHARSLASSHDCVIVAGSSHDGRTFYNTTRVFHKQVPPGGLLYHKQVSATAGSVGEFVSNPPDRRTLLFRAFGINVALLTCLDMLDFASVAAVVKLNERVDLLLVPCYSDKMDALEDAARFVSAAMPGTVVLVNARPSDNREPCRIANFGKFERFHFDETLQSETMLNIYDLDLDGFREKKDDLKRSPTDRMEWLFGARDLEAR